MDIADIDITKPNSARMADYVLGGHDNYEADRVAVEPLLSGFPEIRVVARANRDWIGRIVRASIDNGVTQFLDIGSGMPTADNVHEVAQRHAPDAKVTYVDHDPVVMAHSRHLLAGDDERTLIVEADARDADTIMADASKLLDFDQPATLMFASILHFIPEDDDPAGLVARYAAALAPGSLIAISYVTSDSAEQRLLNILRRLNPGFYPRPGRTIAATFGDLRLLDPGLVDIQRWQPEHEEPPGPLRVLGGLAQV